MKLIKAYIRHIKTEAVYEALRENGFCCMTFVECEGTGLYSDQEKQHLNPRYPTISANSITKLEILAADEHVKQIVEIIRENGRTGYRGDGMIIISPVENVYKVRTDEEGMLAI